MPDEWAEQHGYGTIHVHRWRRDGQEHEYRVLQWRPGVERDRVLFHHFFGFPAPANFAPGSGAAEQFSYDGSRKAYKGRAHELAAV